MEKYQVVIKQTHYWQHQINAPNKDEAIRSMSMNTTATGRNWRKVKFCRFQKWRQTMINEKGMRQSTVKSFLFCPRAFKYQHIDNQQPAFRNAAAVHGTVVHRLLHLIHTDDWNLDTEQFYPLVFDFEEFHSDEAETPIFWKEDRDKTLKKLKAEAIEMLDNYRKKDYNQNCEVILSEAKFTLQLGKAGMFTGTIDQLRKLPDGKFELVDFKTSKFAPVQAFLDVDYQFGIYANAVWQGVFKMPDGSFKKVGIPPEMLTVTWYHLRDHLEYKRNCGNGNIGDEKGDPRRTTKRTRKQLLDLKNDLQTILRWIRNLEFPKNPGYSSCPLCSYSQVCLDDSAGNGLSGRERKSIEELVRKNGELIHE